MVISTEKKKENSFINNIKSEIENDDYEKAFYYFNEFYR